MNKFDIDRKDIERIDFAVRQGLNVAVWEPVSLLAGGLTGALVIKIRVLKEMYVVKLEKTDDENFDLARNYQIVERVSLQGISPKVYFLDATKGVLLMQNIQSQPRPAATLNSIEKMASLIRRLHSENTFPGWKSVSNILLHLYQQFPIEYQQAELVEKCVQQLPQLEKAAFDPMDMRACHCDLNPNNWLFDGENYFLVDWQAASPQSFYFDLSCCDIFFYFYSEELSAAYLRSYLERDPTEIENAKYFLMRIFVNIYFGIGFLSIPLRTDSGVSFMSATAISELPTYGKFMQAIGSGKVNLSDASVQHQFGLIFLNTAAQAMSTADYSRAIHLCLKQTVPWEVRAQPSIHE